MKRAVYNRILSTVSLCLLLQFLQASLGFYVSASESNESPYYQRYKAYPDYCSDPSVMETRSIPPLPDDQNTTTYKSRLQRVAAIIRHGARTPIHYKPCWKGHWDEPDGIWDCQSTTLLSTRPATTNTKGQFLVEKIYDAFLGEKHPSPYRNIMNGTCQDGQLIQQGYDQQIRNGEHLRHAYIFDDGDESNNSDDPRLRLFTTSNLLDASPNDRFLDDLLRYRSDDDQRTLASGQVLLSSMFEPEAIAYRNAHNGQIPVVTHHTADKERDILSFHKQVQHCPRQQAVQERGLESDAYKAFFHSNEAKTMRQLIDDHLEPEGVLFGGIDCMMTSICTDRSLPDVIRDYGLEDFKDFKDGFTAKYGPNRFERLFHYVVQNKTFMSRYDDSELSKMDMGPLWAEIMESQEPFALFSGHDSTVFPLMASLGENVWNATDFPSYASMMIIEFHDVIDKITGSAPSEFPSGKAFRLVYNGNVLTWLMDGCPQYSHLCDMSVFHNRVSRFATRKNHGCGVEEGSDDTKAASSSLSLGFVVGSMLSSFVVGSIVTFLVMQFCRWRPRTKHRNESQPVSTSGREESFVDEPDIVIN